MTKADWDRKLRVEVEGTKVYPSIDALKQHTENTEHGVELEMPWSAWWSPGRPMRAGEVPRTPAMRARRHRPRSGSRA
jgi:hypothetical protein